MSSEQELDFIVEFLKRHVGALRLLAFREDDRNNRRLLFDSLAFDDNAATVRCSPRCNSDTKLLAEMIFGSTPTVYSRETIKVHQLRRPPRLMFTKIFPAHQMTSYTNTAARRDPNYRRFSIDPQRICERSDGNSPDESPSSIGSPSDLLAPRLSSPEQNRRSSESSEDCEILPTLQRLRRQRVGVAVIFTLGEESQSDDELIVKRRMRFLCAQSSAIFAATREELQDVVLTAYCTRTSVVDLMRRAWHRFLSSMRTMCESSCRAHHMLRYFKITWSFSSNSDPLVRQFVETLCTLISKYDTKQTNFFLSTLITSVLALEKERRSTGKRITEIRLTCNNGYLLLQLLDIIGYFLKYVVSDLDHLSVQPLPFSLTRTLSLRTSPKGALASLLSMFRQRKTFREAFNSERWTDSSSMCGRSNGALSPTRSPIPIIRVEENGLNESEYSHRHCDENVTSISSSITGSACTSEGGNSITSVEENGFFQDAFDEVEEIPLTALRPNTDDASGRRDNESMLPLCGDVELHHRFGNETFTSRRPPMDISISLRGSFDTNSQIQEALIIDATTWSVYQTVIDELPCQPIIETFRPRFPSALITELLENVRILNTESYEPDLCLMYMDDEIKTLFSKASILSALPVGTSDKGELCSEFCTSIMRCNTADLSFLI